MNEYINCVRCGSCGTVVRGDACEHQIVLNGKLEWVCDRCAERLGLKEIQTLIEVNSTVNITSAPELVE